MESTPSGGTANSSSDFVRKLYKMLENPTDETIVRWGNDGDSFVVLENEKFTKHILPKHFKHSNFASFVRQLNKYDFHKVRHNTEESGQSPYGPGAWEFKHPDFRMNNKEALDNIRRKAPAARKPNPTAEDLILPTQQIDLINTQLVATQQQLQQLQERYNELSIHHSMLLQELMGVQKTVVNHEHVMQNVMSFLHSVDAQRRRESRMMNPFAQNNAQGSGAVVGQSSQQAVDDDLPASPLQQATKLLQETNADMLLNPRNLEHMNEISMRMNGTLTTPPPDFLRNSQQQRPGSRGAPRSAGSSSSLRAADIDTLVYPVGQTNGIDPMYGEHVGSIPYPLPGKTGDPSNPQFQGGDARKKSAQVDPGWMRQPRILLVEDDPTCRRIGGKFLYAFNCAIDSAFDGLEAVNKMHGGSKYDLVLMDIIMPNLDGVSACHLIRQFDNTPIIAMTSNIRSDDIAMYFQHGMNDVLPKPFTKQGLYHMLQKHLNHLIKQPEPPAGTGLDPQLQSNLAPAVQPLSVPNSATRPTHAHSHSITQSLKEEDSPSGPTSNKSPATNSNWNSPNQVPGVSPVAATVADEYMQHVAQQQNPYAAQMAGNPQLGYQPMAMTGAGGGPVRPAPQQAQKPGQPPPQQVPPPQVQQPAQSQHRRQISEISGGEDLAGNVKRQQMYTGQIGMQQGR